MKKIFFYSKKKNFFFSSWIFKEINIKNIKKEVFYEDQPKKDQILSEKYQSIVLEEIILNLNKFHKIKYSKRLWMILLSRWVKFYVDSIIFRHNYLKQNIKKSNFNSFYFSFNEKRIKPPSTTLEFYNMLDTCEVNNFICYKIAEYFKKNNNINIFKKKTTFRKYNKIEKNLSKIKKIYYYIIKFLNFFLQIFLKNNTPIIVSTYLPSREEIYFQIKKLSIYFWKIFFYYKNYDLLNFLKKYEIKKRKKLFFSNKRNLKSLFINLIDDFLPTCLYENFDNINNFIKTYTIVKEPEFIFTSNEFQNNEFFKFYVVQCLLRSKTKYYVGQHGSKYGSVIEQANTWEELTSDKFITWGWKYKKNHFPIGVLNTFNKISLDQKSNQIKNIIIVNSCRLFQYTIFDEKQKYLKSLYNISIILKKIDKKFEKIITIRFHEADIIYKDFLIKKYRKINKYLNYEFGQNSFESSIDKQSLVVFTYFSTGFLELLSYNKICFCLVDLNKNLYLTNFYKKFIKLKNQIVFDNANSLAAFINSQILSKNLNKGPNIKIINFQKKYAKPIESLGSLLNISKK